MLKLRNETVTLRMGRAQELVNSLKQYFMFSYCRNHECPHVRNVTQKRRRDEYEERGRREYTYGERIRRVILVKVELIHSRVEESLYVR